ncbi:MAG: transcription elongation factor GreA [Bacteroidales bacterium]|jgi:transcription elongation factor GreA|nr:transcription elongation factor GreA [Bacteroidales bacterium]
MGKPIYLTKDGLAKIKADLDELIHVERPKISQQIAEARDKGDLSENAEYDAAKDAQGLMELKISQLQALVRDSRVIDESKLDNSKIRILSTVTIKNLTNNKEMQYTLVPDQESNLKLGKISVDSPIGLSLLGCVVGDKVEVQAPVGIIPFEVVKIS